MKIRDLRPCDWCNKPIAGRDPDGRISIQFYVVTLATAILNPQAINEHMGLALMLGGSHQLAEVFSSKPDVADIVEDQPGAGGRDEALLCFNCWAGIGEPRVRLATLAERVAERKAAAAAEELKADQESRGVGIPASTPAAETKAGTSRQRKPRPLPAGPPDEASE